MRAALGTPRDGAGVKVAPSLLAWHPDEHGLPPFGDTIHDAVPIVRAAGPGRLVGHGLPGLAVCRLTHTPAGFWCEARRTRPCSSAARWCTALAEDPRCEGVLRSERRAEGQQKERLVRIGIAGQLPAG